MEVLAELLYSYQNINHWVLLKGTTFNKMYSYGPRMQDRLRLLVLKFDKHWYNNNCSCWMEDCELEDRFASYWAFWALIWAYQWHIRSHWDSKIWLWVHGWLLAIACGTSGKTWARRPRLSFFLGSAPGVPL